MKQNDNLSNPEPLTEADRRDFLRRASKFAVGAPATALLLQVASRPAKAQPYGPPPTTTINISGPSDCRLKTDIVREGTLPSGIGVYSFRFHWDSQRFYGVMADEVEAVIPAAVAVHRTGYKMVDYSMVLG
jgi:hypothetical protein